MRISALTVRSFKGIRAVSVEVDRELILIGGKNGAGKSSALDALTCLLTGEKAIPAEPIRRGENEAEIVAKIDGYVVCRRFVRKESGDVSTTLTITSSDGAKFPSPQGWLNARLAALGCDPVAFLQAKPAEQAATLRIIAGVDTSAIDATIADAIAKRAPLGTQGKGEKAAWEAAAHYPDAPAAPVEAEVVSPELVTAPVVSAADIVAELAAAQATAQARANADRMVDDLSGAASRKIAERDRLATEATELRRKVAELEAAVIAAAEEAARHTAAAANASDAALKIEVTDPTPIRERLAAVEQTNAVAAKEAGALNAAAIQAANEQNAAARRLADETNAKVRANAERAAKEAKMRATIALWKEQDNREKAALAERAALLAAAKFPIEGLSFDTDGTVTFEGIPLSQQNEATRIKVAMAISLAGDKPLKLVLIRNGSQLDEDSMQQVIDIAHEAGAQLWIERVGTGDAGAVVIADGGVA